MIKAVIFDMDGVLIDAKEWHYEALNQALALFGFTIPRRDHLTTFDGLPTKEKLLRLSEQDALPSHLHGLISDIKQKRTMDFVRRNCVPNFTHQLALTKLKNRGLSLAVCSNSISSTIDTMLTRAQIIEFFDFYLSADHVSSPKPDPEIYLSAIEKLKLEPSECLILEDNFNGLQAAEASGANVLEIKHVEDVNIWNIEAKIKEIENVL